MGNQGAKNWKLTILFAVSLMLIAGLFASSAIAHPDEEGSADGHGTIAADEEANHGPGTIAVKLGTVDSDGDFNEKRSGTYYFAPEAARQALQFTYEVKTSDVTDHTFQLQVPSGFAIGNGHVRITEYDIGPADILFQTDGRGNILDDEGEATDEDLTSDYASDDDRINIDLTDDDIVNVEIVLGRDWSDGGRLVIIFGRITVPALDDDVPSSTSEGRYTFTARSSSDDLEADDTLDNEDDHLAAQPIVFVGNTDGAGSVTWAVRTLSRDEDGDVVINDTDDSYEAVADERATDFVTNGLHPSISRVLEFTYTNGEDTQAGTPLAVTKNNNMAGGQVRLEIPRDWPVSKNWIKVIEGDVEDNGLASSGSVLLYESDSEGFDVAAPGSADEDRVKVSASRRGNVSSVTVNLDDGWAADDQSLVILFGEVTVPGDSGGYEFTTESKGSGKGSLADIDVSPSVMVGNIDPGKGKVEIEPERVYEGQTKVNFTITFEATGPMYDSYIHIRVPDTLSVPTTAREDADGDPSKGYVRVSGTGSVRLGTATTDPISIVEYDQAGVVVIGTVNVTINSHDMGILIAVEEMDSGEKVVVEYDNVTVGDEINPSEDFDPATSQFIVATSTRPLPSDQNLLELDPYKEPPSSEVVVGEYTITIDSDGDGTAEALEDIDGDGVNDEFVRLFTFTDSDTADTEDFDTVTFTVLMDGWTHSESGSGKMVADPKVLEKGSANEDITLTYTADTDLQFLRLNIEIPSGLIETPLTNARGDGQVTGDGVISDDENKNELTHANSTRIRWNRGDKKIDDGDEFDTIINNVAITDSTEVFTFTTEVNGTEIDAANQAKVTVVGTGEDVDFDIINLDNDNTISSPEFPARSMQQIGFRFTLTNTSIEAGGKVSLTLPKDWSQPTKVDDKGRVAKGKTAVGIVSGGLKDKTTRNDPATPDDTEAVDFLVLGTSGQTITVDVKQTRTEPIIIQYGAEYEVEEDEVTELHIREAMIQADAATGDDKAEITAEFKAADGMNTYDLDTIEVEVTNIEDGAGSAMINETEINAGSTTNEIVVTFTAKGTMDLGAVSLELPNDDWGAMQDDELELNYIEVSGPRDALDDETPFEIMDDGLRVEAYLNEFEEGDKLTFTYGGGTGDRANRGAVAQTSLGEVPFIIESDGDGNGDFELVTGDKPPVSKSRRVDGRLYEGDPAGELVVEVVGATDGTGVATREIRATERGDDLYDGSTTKTKEVHAGDGGTHIRFTYTPTETIRNGELKFLVPANWSPPQGSRGEAGNTRIDSLGAQVGTESFNATERSATVTISADKDDEIIIDYGMGGGDSGAVAPSEAGSGQFTIQVKGASDDDFDAIAVQPKPVKVRVQASGAGVAMVSSDEVDGDDILHAGDMGRAITIDYTAVGEIKDGTIKLTVPAAWSEPMADDVTVEPAAAYGGVRASGDYTADQLTDLAADADDDVDLVALTIIVDGVAMEKGDTITITYANAMVQPTKADGVNFKVELDGGDGPDTGPKEVTGDGDITHETTVDVEAARAGSGGGMVAHDPITTGATVETITFTYIPAGEIFPRTQFRVTVPDTWSQPSKETAAGTAGSYAIKHMRHDEDEGEEVPIDGVIEKRNPVGSDMVARVQADSVLKGDQIIFEYQNAVAPGTVGSYEFEMSMDGEPLASGSPSIIVQGSDATQLMVEASGRLSVDTTDPISITVTIQDDETPPNTAVRTEDTTVELSSDSGTGEFSMTADGTYTDTLEVTISMGMPSSEMVFYNDSEIGTATITADSADLDPGETPVEVYTDVVAVGTVTFALADSDGAAKAGTIATTDDVVTVTTTGATSGKMAKFSIGTAVMGGGLDMEESTDTAGTYTGSWTVVADLHDGSHTVSVAIEGESDDADAQLTIDTTAPTVTASASPAMVANGDTVTISATVTGATSVTANVSMLDTTQTEPVTFTDGGAGIHTYSLTINSDADDGPQEIIVTATDAAGNEADATAMVTLDNTVPMITDAKIDMPSVMAGGEATISATLNEVSTVEADASGLNADATALLLTDEDGDLTYTGSVMVNVEDSAADGAVMITVKATDASGNEAESATVTVTLDNTVPMITDAKIDMLSVMVGGEAIISATLSEASTAVTANVTALNAAAPTLSLMDADGDMVYEGTVIVTAADPAADGEVTITITAADAAGNEAAAATVMVTLDNTAPVITAPSGGDETHVMAGDMVPISATLSEASTVEADASGLNADAMALPLTDEDGDLTYTGSVMVATADPAADGEVTITITAADTAGNEAAAATVMVTLDNTAPVITAPSRGDETHVMAGDTVMISAMVEGATSVSADVSGLNAAESPLSLTDAAGDGMYSGSVMVTAADPAADGEVTITITASDATGNAAAPATVMVTLDNTVPEVTAVSSDPMDAKNGDTVMISAMVEGATSVSADVSGLNAALSPLSLTDAAGDGMYSGSVMVTAADPAADGEVTITITASDAAGNAAAPATVMVTLDNTVPEVTEVSVLPSPARNGHEVTISAMVSETSTVTADVSMLDTMQTEMVTLTDDDGDGTYTGSFTISEENEADNGSREVTVMATDAAGNSGTAAGSVDLINTLDYTSMIPQGISLFHVPLDVTAIDGSEASLSMVSDLYKALGDAVNYIISTEDGVIWNSYLGGTSGDAAITADRGLVVVMSDAKEIKFTGNAWGEDMGPGAGEGASMITLRSGLNLVGLPVNDVSVSKVSDIMNLPEFAGKITSIIVSTDDGKFASATVGGTDDNDVRGDASYLVFSSADATQPVMGEGWSNGEMAGAAPIALFGHKVDNQTAALFVEGSLVDELTGLAREGFRIKVKNLSTKAALNTISQGDVAQGGYNMTFVDTKAGNAARIGDVLEISADSPNPLIGVKPVRHIVTIDDVKNSRIQLEDLIAYEIPAETELLRNYPNPFNPETWIPYRLAEDTDVSLTIYDVNGEMVRDIDVGHQTAAVYESRAKAIYWDGRNRFGEQVASGIYFYHLSAGDFSATRKMVILK